MKLSRFFITILFAGCISSVFAQRNNIQPRQNIPTDSIRLSDPFVLADKNTRTYYMTGTGGMMYKSKNLKTWDGPYVVAQPNPKSWMGENPMIWAAEIHQYNNKYYYFATFTNEGISIDTVQNNVIPRRASHVLVSDKPDGPYVPVSEKDYLPAEKPTLDGTFFVDKDKKPYMIFCHEWLQNWNGTIEKILLSDDMSSSVGESKILFRASDSPWSRERDASGHVGPNKVTDGPFLFRTSTGKLGMLWTSWVYDVYTQGVAYSESGTLDGPWIQETLPITPQNFGHGMIFQDFKGNNIMAIHHHATVDNRTVRIPHFFLVSLKGDKLSVVREFKP